MSVLEDTATLSNNEVQTNNGNKTDKNSFEINKVKQFSGSTTKLPNNNQNLEVVVCEIPLDSILREETEKSNAIEQKEFTVAFNFGPRQQAPQGPFQQFPKFGGEQYERPPLVYDPATRNNFVKLVLSLVLLMLIMTAAVLAFVLSSPDVKEFFNESGWLLVLPAMVILIGINYAMVCSTCARFPPCNYMCLILTVIAMSIIAAKITSHYKTELILYAVIATTAVVFVCVLLAFSKFDFTSWMLYVIVIGTAFSVLAMIVILSMLITGKTMKPLLLIILIIGTLIEVVMLTIEIQTVLGGRTVELAEDDYAIGAYMIYTSIISIF